MVITLVKGLKRAIRRFRVVFVTIILGIITLVAAQLLILVKVAPIKQLNLAQEFERREDRHQAIIIYKEIIDRYPRSNWAANAQFNIGGNYLTLGDYKHALEEFQKVADNYPESEFASLVKNYTWSAKLLLERRKGGGIK